MDCLFGSHLSICGSLVYYILYNMHYCALHKWRWRMAAMECGTVTQKAAVPLLSLLRFASVPNKRLGGPGSTKVCDIYCCPNVLIANDKMLN